MNIIVGSQNITR